jgi:hypothetical protein
MLTRVLIPFLASLFIRVHFFCILKNKVTIYITKFIIILFNKLAILNNLEVGSLTGTVVNFFAIIVGSFIGMLIKGGINENISKNIMDGLSLCVLFIGILNII